MANIWIRLGREAECQLMNPRNPFKKTNSGDRKPIVSGSCQPCTCMLCFAQTSRPAGPSCRRHRSEQWKERHEISHHSICSICSRPHLGSANSAKALLVIFHLDRVRRNTNYDYVNETMYLDLLHPFVWWKSLVQILKICEASTMVCRRCISSFAFFSALRSSYQPRAAAMNNPAGCVNIAIEPSNTKSRDVRRTLSLDPLGSAWSVM